MNHRFATWLDPLSGLLADQCGGWIVSITFCGLFVTVDQDYGGGGEVPT